MDKNDPRKEKLEKLKTNTNKVKFVEKTKNISKYFANSKVVFLSGGTLLIESLFFDTKRYICSIAPNQIKNCLSWEKLGYIDYLGDLSKKNLDHNLLISKIGNYKLKINKILNKNLINGKKKFFKI